MHHGLRTLMILAVLFLCAISPARAGKVYWAATTGAPATTRALVLRANDDGTGQQVLFSLDPAAAIGIGLSLSTDKMYWADRLNGSILRADLNGCGSEYLVTGQPDPERVVVDEVASKIYWANDDGIRRSDLNGGAIETVVAVQFSTGSLAVDRLNNRIYFGTLDGIFRVDLDGANLELVLPDSLAVDLAIDAAGGKLYWVVAFGQGMIRRANLDGSGIELVIDQTDPIQSLALDLSGSRIYFGYGFPVGSSGIRRAGLDGSNIEDVVSGLSATPNGIALDLENEGMDPASCADGVPATSLAGMIALTLTLSLLVAWFGWRHRNRSLRCPAKT